MFGLKFTFHLFDKQLGVAIYRYLLCLQVPKDFQTSNKIEIYVKHRPTVPDNQRCWKVFQDDEEIKDFLQIEGKFEDISIDTEAEGVN